MARLFIGTQRPGPARIVQAKRDQPQLIPASPMETARLLRHALLRKAPLDVAEAQIGFQQALRTSRGIAVAATARCP